MNVKYIILSLVALVCPSTFARPTAAPEFSSCELNSADIMRAYLNGLSQGEIKKLGQDLYYMDQGINSSLEPEDLFDQLLKKNKIKIHESTDSSPKTERCDM